MKKLMIATIFLVSSAALANKNSAVQTNTAGSSNAVTAADQGATQSDTDTTRLIRQRINQDQAISMMGKNVTIISKDGAVTIKGPVSSTAEKNKIHRIATDVVGKTFSDEMTISK